jgi:polyisoprenoid-binding protein YceI
MSWRIDPSHSQITFSVRHMMISNVRGRFENFTGTVEFDEQAPTTRSSVEVQIEAASINTRDERRDAHLKSADFLNAEKYPYLVFKSKRVEAIDAHHGRIIGDLTIRDVAKEVTLDVEYAGQSKSPWGAISAGFEARAKINRKDWGLNWNLALETGGVLVGDEIAVEIELEIVKEPEAQPEAVAVAA